MREYFKRLKGHPGVEVAIMLTVLGFFAGATNKSFQEWYIGGLFGIIFVCIFVWPIVLISNISWIRSIKSNTSNKISVEEKPIEEWTPVPGYEKYYIQNGGGKVKSLGNEFDFHLDSGSTEERAAYFTMMFLKGYLGPNSVHAYNINKVIEVMDKKWNITKKKTDDTGTGN